MSRRERKSKGNLSILDEFTSANGAGEITFSPSASAEVLQRIEQATKLADVPLTSRRSKERDHLQETVLTKDNQSTISLQTDNKKATEHKPKLSQSEDKVETTAETPAKTHQKLSTNLVQTENKVSTELSTNLVQTENKVSTENKDQNETEYKLSTELSTQSSTNLVQTENKVSTNCHFSELVGLQRRLLLLIYFSVRKNLSRESEKLSIDFLVRWSESTSYSVRQTIQRLEKKGFVTRVRYKNGRGGWTVYSIPKYLYQDILQNETEYKVSTNLVQTENKVSTELSTELSTSPLVSKIDNINNNYLTNTDSWNLSNLNDVEKYGINSGVIKRAREISPNLKIDQASLVIEKFAVKMESAAGRNIKNPMAYFLSLTKKAASGEDILPEIESESDRLMREMVEKAQKVLKERAEMEDQLLEVSFQEWIASLSAAQKLEIAPSSTLVKEGSHPHTQQFKNYYRENLWPQYKQIMLQGKS